MPLQRGIMGDTTMADTWDLPPLTRGDSHPAGGGCPQGITIPPGESPLNLSMNMMKMAVDLPAKVGHLLMEESTDMIDLPVAEKSPNTEMLRTDNTPPRGMEEILHREIDEMEGTLSRGILEMGDILHKETQEMGVNLHTEIHKEDAPLRDPV